MTMIAAVLTACVSSYGTGSRPTPIPFITPPSPLPSADVAAASPPPPAPAPAVAQPAAPEVLSRGFVLMAVGGSFVRGRVEVIARNGATTATVSASGLPSGGSRLHTVHIHLGSCANPYGGMHLTVLGLLVASPAGTGTLTAPLAPVYVSAGHYVIVYASTSPQVIVACANLAALG